MPVIMSTRVSPWKHSTPSTRSTCPSAICSWETRWLSTTCGRIMNCSSRGRSRSTPSSKPCKFTSTRTQSLTMAPTTASWFHEQVTKTVSILSTAYSLNGRIPRRILCGYMEHLTQGRHPWFEPLRASSVAKSSISKTSIAQCRLPVRVTGKYSWWLPRSSKLITHSPWPTTLR